MKKALLNFLKGKWLKHPLHPLIVHLPMALWPAALLFDLLSRGHIGGNTSVRLSFFCIIIGLAATLVAVSTGLADWLEIKKEKPAWKIGLYHMALNLVVTILFAVNLGLRVSSFRQAVAVEGGPLVLSAIGTGVLFISAYLGGLMIYDYGIAVARVSKKKWRAMAETTGSNLPPQ